jgi:nitrate reductase molybdenum cofactor assembly chaperone NarJ/NarW
MSRLRSSPVPMRRTLRVLAHLLRYPDPALRKHAPELAAAIAHEAALPTPRIVELQALIDRLQTQPALKVEADYVALFDRGRNTSLHLFEHVHGDSRDRGAAMIDLIQHYEQAGLYLRGDELPDYLPVLLEFASTQPPPQARGFLAESATIVRAIFSAVTKRESAYASVIAAVLELAGERVEAVPVPIEQALDESWAEPEVFGGCARAGQDRGNTTHPIHFEPRMPRHRSHPGV